MKQVLCAGSYFLIRNRLPEEPSSFIKPLMRYNSLTCTDRIFTPPATDREDCPLRGTTFYAQHQDLGLGIWERRLDVGTPWFCSPLLWPDFLHQHESPEGVKRQFPQPNSFTWISTPPVSQLALPQRVPGELNTSLPLPAPCRSLGPLQRPPSISTSPSSSHYTFRNLPSWLAPEWIERERLILTTARRVKPPGKSPRVLVSERWR